MNWITRGVLMEQHGYRSFRSCRERSTALYQKTIWLGTTKLYSINFHEYNFTDVPDYPELLPRITFEPEVQFNLPDGSTFNTTLLLHEGDTVEKVETFFHNMFWNMGCLPYEGDLGVLLALAEQAE
jgi:hypothetical protein